MKTRIKKDDGFAKLAKAIMSREVVLYHRRRDGGVKIWACAVEQNRVTQTWGVQGGKMQSTTHVVKGNDRAPENQRAQERFNKLVRGRMKKGYVKDLAEVCDTVVLSDTTMRFDCLPKQFAPAKPHKTGDPEEFKKWEDQGLLFIQRKRDGMRHFIVSDANGQVRVFSSGKDDVTEHLSLLVKGLVLPPQTVLDAELTVTDQDGNDSFKSVSSIARSLPLRARTRMKYLLGVGMRVQLLVFDCLFYKGEAVWQYNYQRRYNTARRIVPPETDGPVAMIPILDMNLKKAIQTVRTYKWEGLVVWRRDQSTVVQMNGSHCRVNCWKLKPVQEADVVATSYELGKGKNSKVVGKFRIARYDPKYVGSIRHLVPMGKCGTGLDDQTRREALRWKYPCVIQIEYDNRTDKGFRFPVFIRKREDKAVHECQL